MVIKVSILYIAIDMSQLERNDYFKFRQIVKGFSTISGIWYYKKANLLYRCIPFKFILIFVVIGTAAMNFIYQNHSKLSIVVRGLNLITGYSITTFKVTCLQVNKKNVKNLQKALDSYLDEVLKDSNISSLVLKNVGVFKSFVISYVLVVVVTVIIQLGFPLYIITNAHYHHVNLTRYPLIYPTRYFWGTPTEGFLYKLHFLLEAMGIATSISVSIGADTLYVLYIFQLIGQLKKISYYVTHTDDKSDEKTVLSDYVSQYVKCIKCRDAIEKIYGPIVVLVMCTSAVMICSLFFQLTHIRGFSGKSIFQGISFTTYLATKMIQAYMFAWSGSCLIEASEECQYAVYTADWYGNKKLMSSIVIILSQRPLILTACNFSIVNVRIFVMVMNTSISYFFLLKTIEEQN